MVRFSTLTLLVFVCISQIAYSQAQSNDTLNGNKKDSLSKIEILQKEFVDPVFSSNELKINRIKISLDSISRLTATVKNDLDTSTSLTQINLLERKQQLSNAQEKVNELSSIIKESQSADLDTLGLSNTAYALYFKIGTLKSKIDERIRKLDNQLIKKKAGYIWNAPIGLNVDKLYNSFKSELKNPFSHPKNIEWGGLFLLLILSVGYFYWVFQNRHKTSSDDTKRKLPIAQTLLFFLILLPFFDRSLSIVNIDFILLSILILTSLTCKIYIKIHFKHWWIYLVFLFVTVLLFNYLLISNAFFIRITAIILNIIALYFSYKTVNQLKKNNNFITIFRALYYLFISLNVIAILSNVMGQINVSKILSITAMTSGAHVLGLIILIRIITEDVNKQIEHFKASSHFMANLEPEKTVAFIHKSLVFVGLVLWLMVFLINLNILDSAINFLGIILNKPHAFGGFNFTLGNIISFILIIKLASWFQKNLNTLLLSKNKKPFISHIDEKGTKVALLRLLIIIIGFLLAITALGISMTKLTVILGALSVGIGLGMQNIFNNFVSGIILIFEKPFKIGDFISLNDKKGRVQKIGIRSSTLLTDKGSEIIIPNGDLVSGQVINWTHKQLEYKAELNLKLSASSNLKEIKKVILEEITKSKYLVKDSSIEILYKTVSINDFELTIKCWIVNIYKEPKFKSSIIEEFRTHFTNNEIVSLG